MFCVHCSLLLLSAVIYVGFFIHCPNLYVKPAVLHPFTLLSTLDGLPLPSKHTNNQTADFQTQSQLRKHVTNISTSFQISVWTCQKYHLSLVEHLKKTEKNSSCSFHSFSFFLLFSGFCPSAHFPLTAGRSDTSLTGDPDISPSPDSVKCKSGSRNPGNISELFCAVFWMQGERVWARRLCDVCAAPVGGCVCGCPAALSVLMVV